MWMAGLGLGSAGRSIVAYLCVIAHLHDDFSSIHLILTQIDLSVTDRKDFPIPAYSRKSRHIQPPDKGGGLHDTAKRWH